MGGGQDWAQECYEQQRVEDDAIAEAFAEYRASAEQQLLRAANVAEAIVVILLVVLVALASLLFG